MTINTLGNVTEEAKEFYDRDLLFRATPLLQFHKCGQAKNLKSREGNSISWRRFEALALATSALTESVTPTGVAADVTEITATVAQYGNYVEHSDLIDMLGIDPFVSEMNEVLGENGGQTIDAVVRSEVITGTNVLYATGSTRGAQAATNVLTYDLLRKAVRNLQANNARPFMGARNDKGMGGMFMCIMNPYTYYDLVGDTTIESTFTYSDPQKLYKYELPVVAGVAIGLTTLAPVFTGEGSGGADVYGTLVFGKDAYGVTNVAGTGKFESIVKPRGSGGTSDPLNQRGTIGWKSQQVPKILNNNFLYRIEHGATA